MPGCERARTVTSNRASTRWNHVERRTCVLPPTERERERAVSLFRWHTFATNRLLSRTSRPFLSLSLSPFNSHPRGPYDAAHAWISSSNLSVIIFTDQLAFPSTINIYIYDFNDTSIAVGRLQLFSPSHCHRALLYPSDETLLTNSPVGRHKERRRRKRERGEGRRDFVTDSIAAVLHRTDEFNCDGY